MKQILKLLALMALFSLGWGCEPQTADPPPSYSVTVEQSGAEEGEAVILSSNRAAEGTTVSIEAALNNGRRVQLGCDNLTLTPDLLTQNGQTLSFVMPAEAVVISAVFQDIPPNVYSIAIEMQGNQQGEGLSAAPVQAVAGTEITLTASLNDYREVGLSSSEISLSTSTISTDQGTVTFTMPEENVTISGTFQDTLYTIAVQTQGRETLESLTADLAEAAVGETVTLTAGVNSHREAALSSAQVSFSSDSIKVDQGTLSFTMPEGNVTILGTFQAIQYQISVTELNAQTGESIVLSQNQAPYGASVTMTANLNAGRKVSFTSGQASISPDTLPGAEPNVGFTMPGEDVTVTAEFYTPVGTMKTYQIGLPSDPPINFNLIYSSGGTFPSGSNDLGEDVTSGEFWMGQTEVTYHQWTAIYDWAILNGYTFAFTGSMGDGTGDSPMHPVTGITWRDAIIFCNAMTEYYNVTNATAPDLDVVYYSDADYSTPLRAVDDSNFFGGSVPTIQDQPYILADNSGNIEMDNCTATGFRLPTVAEWECAARYIGTSNNSTNTGVLKGGIFWSPGNFVSGADYDYTDSRAWDYAWFGNFPGGVRGNSGNSTHVVGTAGSANSNALSGNANALGFYDMSGNVHELLFEWWIEEGQPVQYRATRGGNYFTRESELQIGLDDNAAGPNEDLPYQGFRVARTP